VGKRDIFLEDNDYLRFIHDLFEFNDGDPVLNVSYYYNPKTMEVKPRRRKPRQRQSLLIRRKKEFPFSYPEGVLPRFFWRREGIQNGIQKWLREKEKHLERVKEVALERGK